jgi:hypothetical protein
VASYLVQRLNQDGSVCRLSSPSGGCTEGTWVFLVDALDASTAASLTVQHWNSRSLGSLTWPVVVEVMDQVTRTRSHFSVTRVVETRYPVVAIELPERKPA